MKNIFLLLAFALLFAGMGNAHAISEAKTNTLDLRGSTSGSVKLQAPATGGAATYVLPGVDGSAGQALITDGSENLSFAEVGGWTKYTVTHTALQNATFAFDISLFTLAANTMVEDVVIKHSAAYTGTGITAYSISVGVVGDLEKYGSLFDVLQASADGTKQVSAVDNVESFAGTTDIRIQGIAAGANLDQSLTGDVDVWVKTSTFAAP